MQNPEVQTQSPALGGDWEDKNRVFAQLIARARAGSIDAFDELYDRSVRWLLSHVRRVVDDGQAEDVLAEVYIQVWNSLGDYDETRAEPAVWLAMIARSRALDHLRREKRRGLADRDAHNRELADVHGADDPEEILSKAEECRMVQASLGALSAQERLVVGLAYFRDSTHVEIAAVTGLPLGTVKSMMARAQDKLRVQMALAVSATGSPVSDPPPAARTHR